MSEQDLPEIRLSQNQIHSNPILHSERLFRMGIGRREQERLQLEFLIQLQDSGGDVFNVPNFIRVDASELQRSVRRIGVVGLVVDNDGLGYVTRLSAIPHPTWEISVDLPFHYSHIQSLLLRTIGDECLDGGLPELLAFKIRDTLGQRCEGDSMDVAALMAVLDVAAGSRQSLLDATAVVVTPFGADSLRASKSTAQKLDAFIREFGNGSLLIRHPEDQEAAKFDCCFAEQWSVSSITEFTEKLRINGLLTKVLSEFQLDATHGPAIAAWIQHVLADESRHAKGIRFMQRLKNRVDASTPLRLQQEIAYAEEDLYRHLGDFETAISVRTQRLKLEENAIITCYERSASSDNRHAAALYDAHRMQEGADCLRPWIQKFEADHQVCLPETRAVLKNTLARCLAALGEDGWENLLRESLEIQRAIDPASVPRTTNVLVHSLLKANRVNDAKELSDAGEQKTPFDFWLQAELARHTGETWDKVQCKRIESFESEHHAFGFACQAIARQANQELDIRVQYLTQAKQSFRIGAEHDATNVKRLLTAFCDLAVCIVSGDDRVDVELNQIRKLLILPGLSGAKAWYEHELRNIEQNATWQAVDELFCRVPHF